MYTDQYITEEEHQKWFIRVRKDPTKIYWIIEVNGTYVGVINLYNINILNKDVIGNIIYLISLLEEKD